MNVVRAYLMLVNSSFVFMCLNIFYPNNNNKFKLNSFYFLEFCVFPTPLSGSTFAYKIRGQWQRKKKKKSTDTHNNNHKEQNILYRRKQIKLVCDIFTMKNVEISGRYGCWYMHKERLLKPNCHAKPSFCHNVNDIAVDW